MKTAGNTILITGGATGIGLALAEAFVGAGNEVIICGRREEKLKEAQAKVPRLHTRACDVSNEDERKILADWVLSEFKDFNVLVNNAGIQRMVNFKTGFSNRSAGEDEIDINLKAPISLSELFIPRLMQKKEAAIVNISSGLGFVPIAFMPIYCATKAALHSYTMSLRHQLKDTPVKVFEVIPSTVDTELDKGMREKRGQTDRGIPPAEVAKAALAGMQEDKYEIPVGMAERLMMGSRNNPEEIFKNMNKG